MPRRDAEDDDWVGEDDDYEDDSAGDDETTVPCPYCRREIYEDAPRCPYCERYISHEDAPPPRKPWLILIGAALCLLVVYFWIVG